MNNVSASHDSIAALATAPGGAIGVVRISGPQALGIAKKCWQGPQLDGDNVRRMMLGRMRDPESGELGDQAIGVFMQGPKSFTGEDVVELQCHGGTFTSRHSLSCALRAGARHAEAGEFTRRAFINGRMDLTQAEAVMDLIGAQSEMAMRVAARQLEGRLGNEIRQIYEDLSDLLSEIEVRMDFVDEDLEWTPPAEMLERLNAGLKFLRKMLAGRRDGEVLREGVKAIIGGPPNAGKSSLLNYILGHDRAIVTDIPGTTRDTLEELAHVRGIPLRLIDTAGIRESEDIVERTGIERSLRALGEAQLILWMCDLTRPLEDQLPPEGFKPTCPFILLLNKTDLAEIPNPLPQRVLDLCSKSIAVSVQDDANMEALYNRIEEEVWQRPHEETPDFAVNARHAQLAEDALENLLPALDCFTTEQWELAAVNLRGTIKALGEILGETVLPDILHTIFGKYCIGK